MGAITKYNADDYLDYKCPKRVEVIELIVNNKIRSKGIGNLLIQHMEKYFKTKGCEYIIIYV